MPETRRQRDRRLLRQGQRIEQMKQADRLRAKGHCAAADEIEVGLGLKKAEDVTNPRIAEARKLLAARRPQAFYDLVKSGGLTRADVYELTKIVDAIPEELEVLEEALALTQPDDMNADWFGGAGPTGPGVQVVG